MANKIEPVVEINLAETFGKLHKVALDQASRDAEKLGFKIENSAFSGDKGGEIKAGEYLISLVPNKEDAELATEDDIKAGKNVLRKYLEFFVGADVKVDDNDFSLILEPTTGTDEKKKEAADKETKDAEKDESNENKKQEEVNASQKISYKISKTSHSLLNQLFDDYVPLVLTEDNEDNEQQTQPQNSKADDKKENKDGDKENDETITKNKVKGLSLKYTCQLAGQKVNKLAQTLKNKGKGMFGDFLKGLSSIKITGGVFGDKGLAVGKILDPDWVKDKVLKKPDIDANTIANDIKEVAKRDFTGSNFDVKVEECQAISKKITSSSIRKVNPKVKAALTKAKLCITIFITKDDDNYDSINEKAIAEICNKSFGRYFKLIDRNKLSEDEVFKIENFNPNYKAAKQKIIKRPNTAKESFEKIDFLTYCALVDTNRWLLEDNEEEKEPTKDKVEEIKQSFQKEIENNITDAQQLDTDFADGKSIKAKVKELNVVNEDALFEIAEDKNAFFVDLVLKNQTIETSDTNNDSSENNEENTDDEKKEEAVNSSNSVIYSKLLNLLFEDTIIEADDKELAQSQLENVKKAIAAIIDKYKKEDAKVIEAEPIVFNYEAIGESLSHNFKLLKFIYHNDILNESNSLILEKADPIVLNCFDEIDRVGVENIKNDIDKFRTAWQDNIKKAKDALPAELAKRSENSKEYIKYLKNKYVKGADGTPFDKSIISKLRKATSTIQVKNLFASYGSNGNEFEFDKGAAPDKSSPTIPEYYAAWQALKTLPSQKKIKVSFYTADENGKKQDEIDTITIIPGHSIDDISNGDNKDTIESFKDLVENNPPDGCRFDGYEPSLDTKLTDDTEIIAKYAKKDAPIEIEFYDVDPENPDDESKWKDIDIQEFNPENPDNLEFPKEDSLGKHKGWKFERWVPSIDELKKNPPKTATKVKATYSKSTVTITLYDSDVDTGKKIGEPIETYEIEKGTAPNTGDGEDIIAKANKKLQDNVKDGYTSNGWLPKPSDKVEENTELVHQYIKNADKDKEFTIIFQYPPDPSNPDEVEEIPGDNSTQKLKAGEAAEAPTPPEIEGWKFEKWDNEDWKNVRDDVLVIAEYKKPIMITFKVPTDLENPDGDKETVGDPIEYIDDEPINAPTPPEKDGYEFEKWDPNPENLKPEESTDVVGIYKKKEEPEEPKEEPKENKKLIHEVYVIVDENDLAKGNEKPDNVIQITPMVPKDPSKPKDLKPLTNEPISVTPEDDLDDKIPAPPDYSNDGYEFKEWKPSPKELMKNGKSGQIVATYSEIDGIGDLYIIPKDNLKYKNEKNEFTGSGKKEMKNGNAFDS